MVQVSREYSLLWIEGPQHLVYKTSAKIMRAQRVTYFSVFKLWFTFSASPSAVAPLESMRL